MLDFKSNELPTRTNLLSFLIVNCQLTSFQTIDCAKKVIFIKIKSILFWSFVFLQN